MGKKCNYPNCKTKINELLTITCRCNNMYCNDHSFFTNHNCSFDYFTSNKDKLKNNLVKCNRDKVANKI